MYYKSTFLICLALLLTGCQLDNYPAPTQTLKGKVIDKTTGEPIETEYGSGGVRIKLVELSWSDNPTPFYFHARPNGTFRNTKLFKGKYRISVQGPFVPIFQRDDEGNIIVDKRKTVMIEGGITRVNFKVMPFLTVRWVGEPVINPDSTVTVKVKVTRGTNNPKFQAPLTDVNLYVNRYSNVSNNSYTPILSTKIEFSGKEGNKKLGKIITITTDNPLTLHGVDKWFIRVGARTNYGLLRYNYTEPIMINLN